MGLLLLLITSFFMYISAAIRDLYKNDRSSDHSNARKLKFGVQIGLSQTYLYTSFLSLLCLELRSFPRGNNSLTFSYILQYILPPPPLPPLVGTVLYYTLLYFTVMYQYNTIQYNAIQYNTIQYNTKQNITIQYNTMQYNTIQYST